MTEYCKGKLERSRSFWRDQIGKSDGKIEDQKEKQENKKTQVFYRYTVLIQKSLPPDIDPKRKEVDFLKYSVTHR